MGSGGGIKEIRDQGQTGAKLATLCIVLGATNEPAVTEAKQKKKKRQPRGGRGLPLANKSDAAQ